MHFVCGYWEKSYRQHGQEEESLKYIFLCFNFLDQSNWELHTAFFEAIVDVAAMIGPKSLDIVEALLQQVSRERQVLLLSTSPLFFFLFISLSSFLSLCLGSE